MNKIKQQIRTQRMKAHASSAIEERGYVKLGSNHVNIEWWNEKMM